MKPDSPPFIIISSEKRRRSKVNMKSMTLFEEMILLHEVYEEEDHSILTRALESEGTGTVFKAWLDRDAFVHSSLHKSENSGYLLKERESCRIECDKPRNRSKIYRRTRYGRGGGRVTWCLQAKKDKELNIVCSFVSVQK
ncbi:MAG: hypothetical protein GY861_00750 [bacterium]|nr:hypothetical protein [bacterium]